MSLHPPQNFFKPVHGKGKKFNILPFDTLSLLQSSLVPTNLGHFLREYIIKTFRKSFNKHSRFWRYT